MRRVSSGRSSASRCSRRRRCPGETLAADALANAIAPVFAAAPAPGRIAVAMSGGVDSAVALLRAAPNAIGVTLRLWLDPAGPSSERSCCSPAAVIAARETCHRLGLPHVTLDLREEFRATVVRPFVEGYAQGLTPNPCMRCNGRFRFDALVDFTERAGADVLWTGHYARIVERDGLRLIARGDDPAKDQSYMLATVDPALLDRVAFPLGGQGKRSDPRRGGRCRPRRCRARREPGGVLPRRRRLPHIPRAAGARSPSRPDRRRGRRRARPPRRRLALSHPDSAAGSGSPPRSRSTPSEPTRRTNTLTVGPRSALEVREVERPRPALPAGRACRGEAALPIRRRARDRRGDGRRIRAPPRAACVRGRAGSGGRALRR